QVILKEIAKKPDLVLGITIGTEISLNASITPADEFLPYGYRSTQDLSASRAEVVRKYLQDNARLAVITGIPKDKIFTHIWVEAIPGDKRYVAYAPAAFNLYSNPGASFYGFAGDPLSLPDWKKMLTANGNPNWGAVEYSAGTTQAEWLKGLTNTFTNTQDPGSMMIIYNWGEQKNTGAVAAIKSFIAKPLTAPECIIETPSSLSQNFSIDPTSLQWTADSGSLTIIHIQSGITADPTLPDQKFEVTGNSFSLPTLKFGNYTWWAEADGCDNTLQRFSSPQNFLVTYKNPPSTTPWWVNQIISFLH
ncbi:MAG TPA: hypothetical protein VLH19_01505, partial [Patescibacteria group bacterium]|nr:hypothetical protein [Patescibacteria group bacterium]